MSGLGDTAAASLTEQHFKTGATGKPSKRERGTRTAMRGDVLCTRFFSLQTPHSYGTRSLSFLRRPLGP